MHKQQTVRFLYRKLLGLYPQEFKGQLSESMEQTFNDLLNEKRYTRDGLFGFVLWTFMETLIEITREHILLIAQGDPIKNIVTSLKSPSLISLILVLPFMILELVNRRSFNNGFPIPLFVVMWIVPVIFIITLMTIVRNVRAGNSILANPMVLLLRVVFLIFIALFWAGLLIDQWACFMGVPNCD